MLVIDLNEGLITESKNENFIILRINKYVENSFKNSD